MKVNSRLKIIYFSFAFISVFLFGCTNRNADAYVDMNSAKIDAESIRKIIAIDDMGEAANEQTADIQNEEAKSGPYDYRRYKETLKSKSTPTTMGGVITEGYTRDILFANGTDITVYAPDIILDDKQHDEKLQEALNNGLSPENRGYGAIVTWKDKGKEKYVILSNMAEIYGGSYKENLNSDISITFAENGTSKSIANISFLFGGSMMSDVVGNININVKGGMPMYVYGGSFNGDVYGNISISYEELGKSIEVAGGGLALSAAENVSAICFGNINLNISGKQASRYNLITGGGVALTDTAYLAISDVYGNTCISIENEEVYEICGGGMAATQKPDSGIAMANVYGNTRVEVVDTKLVYDDKSEVSKCGIVCGGGMADSAVAIVSGDTAVNVSEVKNDRKAAGFYAGGIYSSANKTALTNVYGKSSFEALDENDKYPVMDSKGTIGEKTNILVGLEEILDFTKLKKLNNNLDSEELIEKINVTDFKKCYKNSLFTYIQSDKFSDILKSEKAFNMVKVSSFENEKLKNHTSIYYPRPGANFVWNGNN